MNCCNPANSNHQLRARSSDRETSQVPSTTLNFVSILSLSGSPSMREEHYVRLPAQGNIYSTARLGNISILGTGDLGKVYAHKSKEVLEELQLTELPKENIDIVSVDAYDDPFPVLAVTFVDTENTTFEDEIKPAYLQIYASAPSSKLEVKSECDDSSFPISNPTAGSDSPLLNTRKSSFVHTHCRPVVDQKVKDKHDYICKQLDIIGTRASTVLQLNFIPYHLYHVLAQNEKGELCTLFLLSGCDRRIHTYEPIIDEPSDTIMYSEVPTRSYFPEFPTKFDSIVTRIAVEFITSTKKRVTICGLEDGILLGYIVTDSSIPKWTSIMDESIESDTSTTDLNSTSVTSLPEDSVLTEKEILVNLTSSSSSETKSQLASDENVHKVVNHYSGMITCIQFSTVGISTNVTVSSSASPVYHYTNIFEEKFKEGLPLKFSSKWDCVQSVCVADVDFDGQNEILIGTFACTLLVYKYFPDVQNWVIVAHRKVPGPIFSISFFDFYIYITTTHGLHMMEFSNAAHYLKYGLTVNEESATQFARDYKLEKSLEDGKLSAVDQEQ